MTNQIAGVEKAGPDMDQNESVRRFGPTMSGPVFSTPVNWSVIVRSGILAPPPPVQNGCLEIYEVDC